MPADAFDLKCYPGWLTVAELIAQLQTMPQDAKVKHDGCDCTGICGPVSLGKDDVVYISRLND